MFLAVFLISPSFPLLLNSFQQKAGYGLSLSCDCKVPKHFAEGCLDRAPLHHGGAQEILKYSWNQVKRLEKAVKGIKKVNKAVPAQMCSPTG